MRRALFAALLATILLAWPVSAQLIPTTIGAPSPTNERVLIDTTLMTLMPSESVACMQIEAGKLTVRVRLVEAAYTAIHTYRIGNYRGRDGELLMTLPFEGEEQTATVELIEAAGIYCWSIYTLVGMEPRRAGPFLQLVSLKMTLTLQ
jgi:hypothetical protein